MKRFVIVFGMILLGITLQAKADTISFANQPPGANSGVTSSGPETITEGLATFNGGTILTNEINSAVGGNVYATASKTVIPTLPFTFFNPITITFSQAVNNLSLVVVNNIAATYILTDNNGKSVSGTFPLNDNNGLLSLNDTNILSATIGPVGPNWDFALSGGSYTPTPEPGTLVMLGTGLLGLVGAARRKWLV